MRRNTILFLLCSLFVLPAAAKKKVQVIAHRGCWKAEHSAQNSLRALELAQEWRVYGSEFDVHLTADNVPVVCHDNEIQGIPIQASLYADIKELKLPNGERLPTLMAYLEKGKRLPHVRLIFELKPHATPERNREAAQVAVGMVNSYGLQDRTEYITFDLEAGKELIRLTSGVPVAYLNGDLAPERLKELGFSGLDYSYTTMKAHPEWFAEARNLHLTVNVWTVNDPEQIREMIQLGADYITTDEPLQAMEASSLLQAGGTPKREIRAVWMTTIYGLDWPGKPATDKASRLSQQKELCDKLDRLKEAHFNSVFLQVRLRGDVIYPSAIEPFNRVFSGKTDVSPGYDPLAFAIEECHKRGMECHAWLVTFPLGTVKTVGGQGSRSVVKRKPALCKKYNDEWFLDPGIPETTAYILSLVKEIVNGYDVDGIHFDYIRYPEKAEHFPDKKTYDKYGRSKKVDDWRRENINRMVVRIYDWVKETKPWVQVSSSPLGKYSRIGNAPDAGWTAYESVFQDPQNWMKEGKHDMIVPMMYYKHNHFFPFVDNWVENCNGRLVVPGLGAYRMIDIDGNWTASDIAEQLAYGRKMGTAGSTFFRSAHILNNTKGLYDLLKRDYFRYPAQLPPLTWLSSERPPAPDEVHVESTGNGLKLSWRQPGDATTGRLTYTVYCAPAASVDTGNPADILETGLREPELFIPIHAMEEREYTFRVTASDRYHTESMPSRETYYYLSTFPK